MIRRNPCIMSAVKSLESAVVWSESATSWSLSFGHVIEEKDLSHLSERQVPLFPHHQHTVQDSWTKQGRKMLGQILAYQVFEEQRAWRASCLGRRGFLSHNVGMENPSPIWRHTSPCGLERAFSRQSVRTFAVSNADRQRQQDQEEKRPTSGGGRSSTQRDRRWNTDICLTDFPKDKIRNFSIVAHVDHGKSTLADRLMESTGAITPGAHKGQYLDRLQVERERGITVKAQTVSLVYQNPIDNHRYLLNLIDTPGHVDFSYEVSRSLAACDGCLLLVDATQGVQAQTVANFFLAFEQDLAIIPVLNKVDMASAEPDKVAQQIHEAFDVIDPSECLSVSAKTGMGVERLLQMVVEKISPPRGKTEGPTRLLLFDAYMDTFRGVICLVTVIDGSVKKGDKVVSTSSGDEWELLEVGILAPEPRSTGMLLTGQVGYLITGMKNAKFAQVGDTWHLAKCPATPLPGFREPKSMVFAGIFPINATEFDHLHAAMEKLTLNDSSVSVKRENSTALGAGFRCGFLGLLHMDVFRQRLEQEHTAEVILTSPTVPLKIELATGETAVIESPADFPNIASIHAVWEPMVRATIVTPTDMVGSVMTLCQQRRGEMIEHVVLSSTRSLLRYEIPLAELGGDFYDELKGLSKGLASFDYEEGEYRLADLVRLDFLVNGENVDALAKVVHRSRAASVGRAICESLRKLLDRHQFDVALQAAVGGRVVARETLKAYRKNVLSKCYGGDVTRKRKLLEKQKEGKKRMRKLGSVDVPVEALHDVMRAGSGS